MSPGLYRAMAASVLSLHAAYIVWVMFGAFLTRGRPRLAALHVATLVYGVIIEIFGFWCPLTALETWLEVRGNVPAYRGPFLLHYLDARSAGVVKPCQPLYDLNPFDSILLILRRVGVGARVVPTLLPELPPRVEP